MSISKYMSLYLKIKIYLFYRVIQIMLMASRFIACNQEKPLSDFFVILAIYNSLYYLHNYGVGRTVKSCAIVDTRSFCTTTLVSIILLSIYMYLHAMAIHGELVTLFSINSTMNRLIKVIKLLK